MLEIGVNTYCLLDETEEMARRLYPLGSTFDYWKALSEDQQENLLIESANEIERLPVVGMKLLRDQNLQFPRNSDFYREQTIPKEVKEAQVLNAVDKMLVELNLKLADGKILTSLRAENKLRNWTSGGFKMGGYYGNY